MSPLGSMPLIPLQVDRASIAEGLENQHLLSETSFGRAIIQEYSATSMEFRTIVDDHSPHCQMVTFHVPSDTTYTFPCKFVFKNQKQQTVSCILEHCGNLLPSTGAPGEPPRQETKQEHWMKVGESLNPSFKNRLRAIAPASSKSVSSRRRFGQLREAHFDNKMRRTLYTYADEQQPWLLAQEQLSVDQLSVDQRLEIFLTTFSSHPAVENAGRRSFQQIKHQIESRRCDRLDRLIMFEIFASRELQVNRIETRNESTFSTSVDALKIYPYQNVTLLMLVPAGIDHTMVALPAASRRVVAAWYGIDEKKGPTYAWEGDTQQNHVNKDMQVTPTAKKQLPLDLAPPGCLHR